MGENREVLKQKRKQVMKEKLAEASSERRDRVAGRTNQAPRKGVVKKIGNKIKGWLSTNDKDELDNTNETKIELKEDSAGNKYEEKTTVTVKKRGWWNPARWVGSKTSTTTAKEIIVDSQDPNCPFEKKRSWKTLWFGKST